MRNEEPTRTDPLPGFAGDLAADVGTSLSRESELAEGFADARLVLLGDCCRQDWMRTDRHHSPRTLRRICMLTRSDAG